MDVYFQVWNINRFLKCHSIESDTINSKSLIDSNLYYPENETNISQIIGITKERNYDKYKNR